MEQYSHLEEGPRSVRMSQHLFAVFAVVFCYIRSVTLKDTAHCAELHYRGLLCRRTKMDSADCAEFVPRNHTSGDWR